MPVNDRDHGFTLIELLLAVAILGIISAPLAGVVLAYVRTSDTTAARLTESAEAQRAAAYFGDDVAALGVRSATSPYALQQSVDTTGSASWPYPCASAGTTPLVRFAWDFYPGSSGSVSQMRVAYVLAAGGTRLQRLLCLDSAVPQSISNLTGDLDPATPPTVGCSPACTTPSTMTMTLTLKATGNGATPYAVTLYGQRRQT